MLETQSSSTTNNDDNKETKFRHRHLSQHDQNACLRPSLPLVVSIEHTQARAGDQSEKAALSTRPSIVVTTHTSPTCRVVSCRVPTAGAASRIALAPQRQVPSHLCASFVSARGIARAESGGIALLASLRLSNGALRAGTHRRAQSAVLALNYLGMSQQLTVRDAANLRNQKLSRASVVPGGRPVVDRHRADLDNLI